MGICRVVHVPTVADEDRRRLSRERERLLKESTSHISKRYLLKRWTVFTRFLDDGRI